MQNLKVMDVIHIRFTSMQNLEAKCYGGITPKHWGGVVCLSGMAPATALFPNLGHCEHPHAVPLDIVTAATPFAASTATTTATATATRSPTASASRTVCVHIINPSFRNHAWLRFSYIVYSRIADYTETHP